LFLSKLTRAAPITNIGSLERCGISETVRDRGLGPHRQFPICGPNWN